MSSYGYRYTCPSGYPTDCGSYCCTSSQRCGSGGTCIQPVDTAALVVRIVVPIVIGLIVLAVVFAVRRRRAQQNAATLAALQAGGAMPMQQPQYVVSMNPMVGSVAGPRPGAMAPGYPAMATPQYYQPQPMYAGQQPPGAPSAR